MTKGKIKRKQRALECAGCGLALENWQTVWLGPSWEDRQPFCKECSPQEELRLRALGI